MSPRRRPRRDPWQRSASGLYLPRRNWPPERARFVQRMGAAHQCCEEEGLCSVDVSLGSAYDITFAGIADSGVCAADPPGYEGYCGDFEYDNVDLNHTYRLTTRPLPESQCRWLLTVQNVAQLVGWSNWCTMDPDPTPPVDCYASMSMIVGTSATPGKITAKIDVWIYPCILTQFGTAYRELDAGSDPLDGWTGSRDFRSCCDEIFGGMTFSVARA